MAFKVFTWDDAWREAVGILPAELRTPEALSILDVAFACEQTRLSWEQGEPLALLIRPALPPVPPWTNAHGET